MESWGGSLRISSQRERGTTVSITLPQASIPAWFVPELLLSRDQAVVILDDDSSIHGVWGRRLDAKPVSPAAVVHAHSPAEFRGWLTAHPDQAGRAVFLLDYELRGHKETGLDMAQEFGIERRTILVTSRHEESVVQKRCYELGIKLIPKALVGFVPIGFREEVNPRDLWDTILIDDDALVRAVWIRAAKTAGRRLKTYASGGEFLKDAPTLSRDAAVYVYPVRLSSDVVRR